MWEERKFVRQAGSHLWLWKSSRLSLGTIRQAGRAGPSARPKRTPVQRITLSIEQQLIVDTYTSVVVIGSERAEQEENKRWKKVAEKRQQCQSSWCYMVQSKWLKRSDHCFAPEQRPRDRRSHASFKSESVVTGTAITTASKNAANIGTYICTTAEPNERRH